MAVLAGTGSAARKGILIKGGDILERMHKVDTVILDKTGTITTGKMSVVDVIATKSASRNTQFEILQCAASAEQGSEHLMGSAIVRHARKQNVHLFPFDAFKAFPGQGVEASVQGARILVGKRAFLVVNGIAIGPTVAQEAELLEQSGKTVVWVAGGEEFLGMLALMDVPKDDLRP